MIIKRGDKGLRVMAVQEMLDLKPADGIFGPKTEEAVKEFQKRNGLVVDGIVGDKTLAVLSAAIKQESKYKYINPTRQYTRTITHLFVHCTAGNQNATPEELIRFFYDVKKWQRPGYHYVISKDGTVTQLWPESKYSNGVAGQNTNSINVAWIGGIDKQHPNGIDNRTDAQKTALRNVLKELKRRYPKAKIMGHRDVPGVNKACPCFNAMVEYKDL